MNRTHIKNKMTDAAMYLKRNTSIIFYIFIAVVVLSYGSLYTYKNYIQTEASTISEEEKFKEFYLNNNTIELVENQYNDESEFYVGKFVIKDREAATPVIANDTLEVSGIARMDDNDLQELNINAKQITPTFIVIEIDNLPDHHVELRLDFNLDGFSEENDSATDETSLYTFVTDEETSESIEPLSNEAYEQQSFAFEIETVNGQIASLENDIEYYNERIETLEDQITDSESELDMMTDEEKTEMESSIASHYSEIESFEEDIEDIENDIEEREEKRSILESNLSS